MSAFGPAVDRNLAARADQVALAFGDRRITFGALRDQALSAAGALEALGASTGDRVAFLLPNGPELIALHLANLLTGRVSVPLNPAYRAAEIAHVLDIAAPRVVVTTRPTGAIVSEALVGLAGSPKLLFVDQAFDVPPAAATPAAGGDPAMLVFTSGTTGKPKGAVLTHENLLASMRALESAWRLGPNDRLLLTLPLFHVHGLAVGVHGMLLLGHSIRLEERFDVDRVLVLLADEREGITLFYGVPTLYRRILDRAAAEGTRFASTLRLFVSGSAPLPAADAQAFRKAFGHAILERYGMSETLMNIAQEIDGERRPGWIGKPLPGVEVRFVDAGGQDVVDGDEGEIWVRGRNVTPGYFRDRQATAAALTADGWFKTGDLGRREALSGQIRITGRAKEMIVSGGLKIQPREVEECLLLHPAVAEAAVVGVPDPDLGEAVAAMIVLKPGETAAPAELSAHCRERLAPYKKPRHVLVRESLPRNALGKLSRAAIAAEFGR